MLAPAKRPPRQLGAAAARQPPQLRVGGGAAGRASFSSDGSTPESRAPAPHPPLSDPAAAAADCDAVVAGVVLLVGLSLVTIFPVFNRISDGHSPALFIVASSAAALVATRLPFYGRVRTGVTVLYRLTTAFAGQLVVGAVSERPIQLLPPTSARAWLAFALGRTSPLIAALLAFSARQATVAGALALAAATTTVYASLQPHACRGLLPSQLGIDDYFTAAARAASHASARVSLLVGAPASAVPAAAAAAAPCPYSSCVAVMTALHAAACLLPALAAHPRTRSANAATAAAIALHALWCILDTFVIERAPCAAVVPHPALRLQGRSMPLGAVGLADAVRGWARRLA